MSEREHKVLQIGTHEADGTRTFLTPGDVCATCSDATAGRWVPVSFCPVLSKEAS